MLQSADEDAIEGSPPAASDEATHRLLDGDGDAGAAAAKVNRENEGFLGLARNYWRMISQNAPFRILWIASVVSELGDWANELAVISILNTYYPDASMLLSVLLIARELPPFLFGGPAGVVADKYDRRRVMLISDLLRMVLVLCLLFVQSKETVPLLFVISFFQFTVSAFFSPAKSALIPSYVEEKEVLYANSLDSLTWSSILFLGAGLGGLLTGLFGTNIAFVLDALSYLGSALLTLLLWRYPLLEPKKCASKKPPVENGKHEDFNGKGSDVEMSEIAKSEANGHQENGMDDDDVEIVQADVASQSVFITAWRAFVESVAMFRDGFIYLWNNRNIFIIAHVKACGSLVWGGQELINLRLAGMSFPIGQGGSISTGLLYAAIGVATGAGPAIVQALLPDTLAGNEKGIWIGFVLLCIGSTVLCVVDNIWMLMIANLIRSSGPGILWVFSGTMLMKMSDAEFRGRVFAYEYAMLTLCGVLSKVAFGTGLTAGISLELLSYLAAGVAFLMLVVVSFVLPTTKRWLLSRLGFDSPTPLPVIP